MRLLFRPIQRLDGFENTQPNADGVLPELFAQAGFGHIAGRQEFRTPTARYRSIQQKSTLPPRIMHVDLSHTSFDDPAVLKSRFPLFLLLGAILGLFGQGLAYAAGPALMPAVEMTAMSSGMDCAGMASEHKAQPDQPCKGLTLACIAQMGCVIPMTFTDPARMAERSAPTQLAATWPNNPALVGLTVPPEPEPPSV